MVEKKGDKMEERRNRKPLFKMSEMHGDMPSGTVVSASK